MFPQTGAENFLLKICDTSAVVVVLPFVPVIAMNGVLVLRYANSISEMIFIFFSFYKFCYFNDVTMTSLYLPAPSPMREAGRYP